MSASTPRGVRRSEHPTPAKVDSAGSIRHREVDAATLSRYTNYSVIRRRCVVDAVNSSRGPPRCGRGAESLSMAAFRRAFNAYNQQLISNPMRTNCISAGFFGLFGTPWYSAA